MCNIVNSPCKICGTELPLHLGDYDTEPEEVECFCMSHLPDKDVRVYIAKKSIKRKGKKWKMGIRDLTDNARKNKSMNYPNTGDDWVIEER